MLGLQRFTAPPLQQRRATTPHRKATVAALTTRLLDAGERSAAGSGRLRPQARMFEAIAEFARLPRCASIHGQSPQATVQVKRRRRCDHGFARDQVGAEGIPSPMNAPACVRVCLQVQVREQGYFDAPCRPASDTAIPRSSIATTSSAKSA